MATVSSSELEALYPGIPKMEQVKKFARSQGFHIAVKKHGRLPDSRSDYGFCWSVREMNSYLNGPDCDHPVVVYNDGKADSW